MPGSYKLEWLGTAVEERIIARTTLAIDKTTKASADDAKANHWWASQSGSLEQNTFSEPAKFDGVNIVGRFGSSLRKEGFYGLFLERKIPWLRPAADRNNHRLGITIRETK